jgi:hypothetical protein
VKERKWSMPETQSTTFHNLVGKLPEAEYLRQFFGVQDGPNVNATHILLVNLLILVLWASLLYPLWIYPVLHGVEAAKRNGVSPNWMWFGIHPLFGWITYLIIRANSRQMAPRLQTPAFVVPLAVKAQSAHVSSERGSLDYMEWRYWGEDQMLPCPFCGQKTERARLQMVFGGDSGNLMSTLVGMAAQYNTSQGGKHIEQTCDHCGKKFESRLAPDALALRHGKSFHQWRPGQLRRMR